MDAPAANLRKLPSVDDVMRSPGAAEAVHRFGRSAVTRAVRAVLVEARATRTLKQACDIVTDALARLDTQAQSSLRPVFNLTGTVLHTNLGRALIAEEAVEAAAMAMRKAVSLEFDLASGKRGERDDHLRGLLRELTGAEDASVVNNNAAAVLLVLNTLARGREAIVSRGELIEIGGVFRMPDIMAGARLVEVSTTNRTHAKVDAIGEKTGLVLKVHTSNYRIEGFTKEVGPRELAKIARERGIPVVHDLGSGTPIDLSRFGLEHEPTVAEVIAEGADLVMFSGDKLLGGPQAGFIVGRKDLLAKINKNPMKCALRVDKMRIAILEATLKIYRDPDRLGARLPTVRLLARPTDEIAALAQRVIGPLSSALGDAFRVGQIDCASQIGSGALPTGTVPSAGLAIRPNMTQGGGTALASVAVALRKLPVPVIGRIEKSALILDLRCLEDGDSFVANLLKLDLGAADALA